MVSTTGIPKYLDHIVDRLAVLRMSVLLPVPRTTFVYIDCLDPFRGYQPSHRRHTMSFFQHPLNVIHLGFGGFGITYKAWDKKLDSVVAIKEYYPSGIVNRPPGTNKLLLFSGRKKKEFEYGLVRFIDEARNMTKFNAHKNIVNVYEYFEENNTAYIVMEFLDGCALDEYMKDNGGKLSVDRSLEIIFNICNALKDKSNDSQQ